MHSAADCHARLSRAVEAMASTARRADPQAIGPALKQVAATHQLDATLSRSSRGRTIWSLPSPRPWPQCWKPTRVLPPSTVAESLKTGRGSRAAP